jgi:FtsP/CotA-like multicopper oxidase with cupredoxin domain
MLRVSIDQHPFNVIEADDTPLSGPNGLHEIPITVGQRYSIVIDTNQGRVGDAFWFRAHAVTGQSASF